MAGSATRYRVYVVQVKGRCPRCKSRRKPHGRCCLYVGSTGVSIGERLQRHLDPPAGWKRTVVTTCGGQLRPDLYDGLEFRTREEAEEKERSLAEDLKARGYVVFQG